MSMGIGAKAVLIDTTEKSVVYSYCGYDLNVPERRNPVPDGRITIRKACFAGCANASLYDMFVDGSIVVENCSNCWRTASNYPGLDVMAGKLLRKLFQQYLNEHKIPQTVVYYC